MKTRTLGIILGVIVFNNIPPAWSQHTFQGEQSLCTATLTNQERNSRINLRAGPGTNYRNLGYGLVGDFVYVLSQSPPEADNHRDSQGFLWYRVGFPNSGAKGWIREDFLRFKCSYD